ncbi:5'-3' exonuclease [Nakamurella silvestris]|nr:5'-3' exonuclease [Nakamurella silvestris]
MLQLVDLAGVYYRAFYALPSSLRSPSGMPVNAIRGSLDIMARMAVECRPTHLVACLDLDWRPDFRVAAIPSYKAHRVLTVGEESAVSDTGVDVEDEPDDLGPQIPVLLSVLAAIGIPTAGAVGYEADDVIGTLAAHADQAVEVVTGDRDLYQVATDGPPPVVVRYIGAGISKMEVLDAAGVAAKYSIPAGSYADFAALRGDPSDGLPGVPGVGDKTAATLISTYRSLEGLIEAIDDPKSGLTSAQRRKFAASRDYLAVAGTVVRVATDAAVVHNPAPELAIPTEPADPGRLAELIVEYGIGASVNRMLKALNP